jgi:replicative DNA helicase
MDTINLNLEQNILLTILEHPKKKVRLKALAETKPEDFGSEWGRECREVMDAQIELDKGLGTALDFAELPSLTKEAANWIKGTVKRRKRAVKRSLDQVDHLIYELKFTGRIRSCLEGMEYASSVLMGETISENDLDKAGSHLEGALLGLKGKYTSQPMLHIGSGQSLDDLNSMIDATLSDRKDLFVTTGMDALDEAYGGFAKGNVVTISANSGGGKTALALNMATEMARRGLRTHYCTLEMTKQESVDRITANLAQVPHDNIRLGNCSPNEKKRIVKAWRRYRKIARKRHGRLSIWDTKEEDEFTPQMLELSIKAMKYDVVVVDYITLFSSKHSDTWKMQMEYSRFFKKMAKRLNCVIVLLTQLNEDDQIKYGKSIKENTDYWFYWKYGEDEEDDEQTDMKTGKARHSKKKTIQLHMKLDTMTITGTLEEMPIAGQRINGPIHEEKGSSKKEKKGRKGRKRQKEGRKKSKSRTQTAVEELSSFS